MLPVAVSLGSVVDSSPQGSYEGEQEEKELLEEQPFLLDTVLCGRGPL